MCQDDLASESSSTRIRWYHIFKWCDNFRQIQESITSPQVSKMTYFDPSQAILNIICDKFDYLPKPMRRSQYSSFTLDCLPPRTLNKSLHNFLRTFCKHCRKHRQFFKGLIIIVLPGDQFKTTKCCLTFSKIKHIFRRF